MNATDHKKEAQRLFNKSAAHLIRQGGASTIPAEQGLAGMRCRYRAPDGKMCGVGPLISDKDWRDDMEDCGPDALAGNWTGKSIRAIGRHLNLAQRIQACHDGLTWAKEPGTFRGEAARGLRHIAEIFELDPSVIYRTMREVQSPALVSEG